MPAVVEARVPDLRACAEEPPGIVEGARVATPDLVHDAMRVALDARDTGEHVRRLRRQRHHARAGLAVGGPRLARLKVHVGPAQGQDLAPAAAGQQQGPDCGDSMDRLAGADRRKQTATDREDPPGRRSDLVEADGGPQPVRRSFG